MFQQSFSWNSMLHLYTLSSGCHQHRSFRKWNMDWQVSLTCQRAVPSLIWFVCWISCIIMYYRYVGSILISSGEMDLKGLSSHARSIGDLFEILHWFQLPTRKELLESTKYRNRQVLQMANLFNRQKVSRCIKHYQAWVLAVFNRLWASEQLRSLYSKPWRLWELQRKVMAQASPRRSFRVG